MPGISDTNSVRASIAHGYVGRCQGLLAFDQIKRCLTNPTLDKTLGTYAEQFRGKLIVVVTHADDTGGSDDVIASTIRGEGQSVGEYFDLAKAIRKLEGEIKQMTIRLSRWEAKVRKWEAKARKSNAAKNLAALNELRISRMNKCLDLQAVQNQQFEALVDARNTNIVRKMQRDKSKHMPAGTTLNVQCISNTHYQSLCRGSAIGGLQLDATHTGLPALRESLLELTAVPKMRAIEELIGNATIFIRGVQLWVEDAPIKNCSGILQVVNTPATIWRENVETYLQQVAIMFETKMIQPLRNARISSLQGAHAWIKNKLLKWHPSSILAFFNKNGNHKTKAIGPEIWNERFTEVQTNNIVRPYWPAMIDAQKELLTSAVEDIVERLKSIPHKLNRKGKMRRQLKVLDSDLQDDKPTAFDEMATSLEHNLIEQSNVIARGLQSDVQKMLDGMKEQFETFLLKQSETAQRRQARRELASILDRVLPTIDGTNAEMEAIKAKYK
nr:hypothetical protein CFP56_13120 [Quercus suber]